MNDTSHAMSRYTAVTENLIEKCQQDYRAGRNLARTSPSLGKDEVAIIVAESLEADLLVTETLEAWTRHVEQADVSDWSLAVLSEIFIALADQVDSGLDVFAETRRADYKALAWTALRKIIDSPTASPMVWYEEIYFMLAQEERINGNRQAIDLMKRGLAHDLNYYAGGNALNFLRDLAETYLWLDDLDSGLSLLAGVLRYDPADIWSYNLAAITFDRFGLVELGTAAAQRALELLQATGDPEELAQQFRNALDELRDSDRRGRESEVSPAVLADFRQALTLDFEARQNQPLEQLCYELVPDLDRVAVKAPKPTPKLPPPAAPSRQTRPPTPGRNDPCWCGSGKKYKQCHLRADQAG